MTSIGERIKSARKKNNMTQEQLAIALNTTKAAISRYESGARKPNIEQIRKICIATNTYVSDLVDPEYWKSVPQYEAKAAFAENPNIMILCGLFEQLNEAGQQKAIEHLEDLLGVEKYRKQV